jgi:hypothetical protein
LNGAGQGRQTFAQRRQVGLACWFVEHRRRGILVKTAVYGQALRLAKLFGEESKEQVRKLQGEIEALLKLRRQLRKSGK